MIRLRKTAVPLVLTENSAEWTKALLGKLKQGQKPTKSELSRYNHTEIKEALLTETNGKCAYCESKVQHVTFGDIEHIIPKASAPEKRYEWANLTIACDVCNTKKSDSEDVIDPYTVDPCEHLTFEGPCVFPLSDEGLITETVLELNRLPLIEQRSDRLKQLHKLIFLATRSPNPNVQEAIRRDILRNEIADDKEYAAMCRIVVEHQMGAPILEPVA